MNTVMDFGFHISLPGPVSPTWHSERGVVTVAALEIKRQGGAKAIKRAVKAILPQVARLGISN
jgi:hypothetical protein